MRRGSKRPHVWTGAISSVCVLTSLAHAQTGAIEPAPATPMGQTNVAAEQVIVYGRLTPDISFTVPQSVEVINNDLIEFSLSKTVGDALRFVPGASRDGSVLDAFGDTYLIRGFYANQTINGISANALRQARDTIGIERIEVLKGPASVLYGQLQPGAVVNVVTKQPERVFASEARLIYGRYDDWRATVDLTGPLTENGNVRFRLTGAYDNADSFVDFWHREHVFVAPVLALDLGARTTLTFEAFYMRNDLDGFVNGLPAEGTVLPNPNGPLPRSLGLADPTFAPSIRENSDVSVRVEHRFSDRARFRTALSWTHEDTDEEGIFGLLGWEEEFRTLTRAVLTSVSKGNTWTAHSDFGLDFETGPLAHEVVLGGDYSWFDRDNISEVGLAPSLDVYNPVYDFASRPETFPLPDFGSTSAESTRTAGLFAQDRIILTDQLRLIGGVRWSHYRQETDVRQGAGDLNVNDQTQTAWTSQLGVLYTPVENIALFANRTTSFLPVEGVTAEGSPLEPETGTQYEVGAKALLFGETLVVDAALFHLKRGNVAVSDRDDPSALIAIGEQVAKGFEASASISPVDALRLSLGYAFTDAQTTEDTNAALVGARIRNVPQHSIVLHGDYVLPSGVLAGLRIGGSATYTGERTGDLEGSFELPSYWRVDAQAIYPLTERVELGVSVENLTDEIYYTHAFSLFEVWPGAPRTWRVSLAARF
jgi:iron complex outermembrane recepter protein